MDLLLLETQGVQLNITLAVGVSSFIKSCGQGVRSVRITAKSDIVLFGGKSNRTF